jgi:hypothetical protein
MLSKSELRAILDRQLLVDDDVYTGHVSDRGGYISDARASLMDAICDPFLVSAKVMAPAFPDHPVGEVLRGFCLAQRNGSWLVYVPEEARFYCFWGSSRDNLGAHGISGSPLACWLT